MNEAGYTYWLPLPGNGTCPTTGRYYYNCPCGNHRCGYCGRRQRDQHSGPDWRCQCYRNSLRNGAPLPTLDSILKGDACAS